MHAPIVVLLGADAPPQPGVRRLAERGVLVVPDAIAGAGTLLALDFSARGLPPRRALARTHAAVRARALDLLRPAAVDRAESL